MDHLHLNKNLLLEGTSDLAGAEYAIMGVPFDGTQTNRTGSRDGPLEIRRTILELDKNELYEKKWVDLGNVETVPGNLKETLARTKEVVSDGLTKNPKAKIIALGGEHTISYPIIEALAKRGKLHVLSFDAHADMRDDYMGEKWGHSTVMRRVRELGVEVTLAGVRTMGDDEREYVKKNKIQFFGPEFDSNAIAKKLSGKRVYISVDLDVLEPFAAPGVGNPEPGGVSFNKLRQAIDDVVDSSSVVGLDVVELSPAYDNGGASSAAARTVVDFMLR